MRAEFGSIDLRWSIKRGDIGICLECKKPRGSFSWKWRGYTASFEANPKVLCHQQPFGMEIRALYNFKSNSVSR
jgi:hypothetical protein